jgi:hypothetical protein
MHVPGPPRTHPRGRLTGAGRAVIVAAYFAGVLGCGWVGWWIGTIYGMEQAMPVVNAPAPPGPGWPRTCGPCSVGRSSSCGGS